MSLCEDSENTKETNIEFGEAEESPTCLSAASLFLLPADPAVMSRSQ